MVPFIGVILVAVPVLAAEAIPPPIFEGDQEAVDLLEPWLAAAMRSTEGFGDWPVGLWRIHLHETDASFELATRSPGGRYALWIGSTLHLRPWLKLQRRDLGALLRHELTHRRLARASWPRWKEEALSLWAEDHRKPPEPWPPEPDESLQKRLDTALTAGTTASQRWAYTSLRAWLEGKPLPKVPTAPSRVPDPWQAEGSRAESVAVIWPPERLPRTLQVNGQALSWKPSARFRFEGAVRFGPGMPVSHLEGPLELEGVSGGWRLTWHAPHEAWIAATTEGELGGSAPFESKRALAAVLRVWLAGHPHGNHPDGSFCPLTHCAVVRGMASPEGREAAAQAPTLAISADRAFFTGSAGGVSWSPRDAWGGGSSVAGSSRVVPGDPWATWTRLISAAQVKVLKGAVRPGLKPGQRGLTLGPSGPYAVESLRLEAGRRFGWTTWPSNACNAELQSDGSLKLAGRGWGHNVGLCLATAIHRARLGDRAEEILAEAFPEE